MTTPQDRHLLCLPLVEYNVSINKLLKLEGFKQLNYFRFQEDSLLRLALR